MKHRNLLYFTFLPLLLFSLINVYATEIYLPMFPATKRPQFSIPRYPEEGFAAGTLVRVPNGYQPIETITNNDLVLDAHLQPKHVLSIARRIAQRSVHLEVAGNILCLGYYQALRLPYNMEWITADTIKVQDYLLNADTKMLCVDQIESVDKFTMLYQLVVEDHIFCVGPSNIVVHNADVVMVYAASFLADSMPLVIEDKLALTASVLRYALTASKTRSLRLLSRIAARALSF